MANIELRTIHTINDAASVCRTAHTVAEKGERETTIHLLRQVAELINVALTDFDPSLTEVVSLTDAGMAATMPDAADDPEPTETDHEIPKPDGSPAWVDRYELLSIVKTALARGNQYGSVTDNFLHVAEMWSAVLGVTVTAERVMLCMAAFKLARLIQNPSHVDSWADLAGYAALGAELGTLPIEPAAGAA